MSASSKDVPKIDSAELKEITEKLITACHILDHEGVTDGYGHVSVRVPGAQAFITIANVSPGCVTRERLIMQDLDGNYLDGAKTPPNEWPIHSCILRARPEIVSVAVGLAGFTVALPSTITMSRLAKFGLIQTRTRLAPSEAVENPLSA